MPAMIESEQIYVVAWHDGKFVLGGSLYDEMPWHLLAYTHLYCLTSEDLMACLIDAAHRGYMILDGASSKRRGIQGFSVGIGPWGCAGKSEVVLLDAWPLVQAPHNAPADMVRRTSVESDVFTCQQHLRDLCERLNAEECAFRSTALRWLSTVYHRLGRPYEPEGILPPPLPVDVAKMCRAAHIGGPIVHAQSSIEPFVSIDRDRAYGQILLGQMPCGNPREVDLGYRPMVRWSPAALMRAMGVATAVVRVFEGPLVPLLPVMQSSDQYVDRTQIVYPTGTMRGTWMLSELAYLEQSGRGEVEALERVVVFPTGEPYAKMIRYIRMLERELPDVEIKRLEHMIYGTCSRRLRVTRFGSVRQDLPPMPSDLLDSKTVERLTTRVQMRQMGLPTRAPIDLPIYEVTGELGEDGMQGVIDRPDRSAWITSSNRIEMSKIIDILDDSLQPERKGDFVGRLFVDGIDVRATPDQIPDIEGASIRMHGPKMHIYRAGAFAARLADGTVKMSSTGFVTDGMSHADFIRQIDAFPDADGGPLAGGRHWKAVPGVEDPRMVDDQVSQPLHLDISVLESVGLS
jgi:hypothetical protein